MNIKKDNNIITSKSDGSYFFVKPFEIYSSYSAFVNTWKIANKFCKDIKDVSGTVLLRSFSEISKFGYISFSKWKSKESFIKYNKKYPVFGYHNILNGSDSNSATQYLYRLISGTDFSISSNKNKVFKSVIFETGTADEKDVIAYWQSIYSNDNPSAQNACLFKSVYKNARYRFIGFAQSDINEPGNDAVFKNIQFVARKDFIANTFYLETIKRY